MSTKRFLLATLGLLLAATLGFGVVGSAAWFTDQDTIPVTGTTGQIVFQTGGPNTAGITLSNMLPDQWSSLYQVDVYNTAQSTTAVKYRITDAFTSQSVGGLYQLLNVRVRHTFCGTPTPGSWPVVYNGLLEDLDLNSIDHAIADTLGVNITHCFFFEFQLDDSAGNAFQNQTVAFDLVFDATQPQNPGWSQ
jgi:predicted ribosomally synthesized peptide with SipW-like signal peptide